MKQTKKIYFIIFLMLLILLAATVWLSRIDLGKWNTFAALVIAGMKASLVICYFMHLRKSNGLIKLAALAGFLWLGILIVLMLSDFLTRNWLAS
jgi:cytochrome c oxidase subunit 4